MIRRVVLEDAVVAVGLDQLAEPDSRDTTGASVDAARCASADAPISVEALSLPNIRIALANTCDEGQRVEMEHGFSHIVQQDAMVWVYKLDPPAGIVGFSNLTVLFRGDAETGVLSHVKFGALLLNGVVIDVLRQAAYTHDPRVAEFPAFTAPNMFPAFALSRSDELQLAIAFKSPHANGLSSVRVLVDLVCDAEAPPSAVRWPWMLPLPRIADGSCALDGAGPCLTFTPVTDGSAAPPDTMALGGSPIRSAGGQQQQQQQQRASHALQRLRLQAFMCPPFCCDTYAPPLIATRGWPDEVSDPDDDEAASEATSNGDDEDDEIPPRAPERVAAEATARALIDAEVSARVAAGMPFLGHDLEDDVTVQYALRYGESVADRLDEIVAWAAQRQILRQQLAAARQAAAEASTAELRQAAPETTSGSSQASGAGVDVADVPAGGNVGKVCMTAIGPVLVTEEGDGFVVGEICWDAGVDAANNPAPAAGSAAAPAPATA